MKILLFNNNDESLTARRIRFLLKDMDMIVEQFPAGVLSCQNGDIRSVFSALLPLPLPGKRSAAQAKEPGRFLIASSLSAEWFHFLAGISCALPAPFLVYGEKAIAAIPADFASCFTPLESETSLREHFESEKIALDKEAAGKAALAAREELLERGVPVSEESLVRCAGEGALKDVGLFFITGYSPNTRDRAGVPLLNISARKGDENMLRLLIEAGADVELKAQDRGNTALIDSASGKHLALASLLLEAGADVNSQSKDGQSALIIASGAGDEKMIELLLEAGADPDVSDSLGVSARKYAALFHQEVISRLFDEYAPVKAV